jgi:integrase
MARGVERLSVLAVGRLKKPGMIADGGGLWLRAFLAEDGKQIYKSWVFRFTMHGKPRARGLGSLHTLGLSDARAKAREARQQVLSGIDPIAERERGRVERRTADVPPVTFKAEAQDYFDAHKSEWRSAVHAKQWWSSVKRLTFPTLGDLPVALVDDESVYKTLKPIWNEKRETAERLRQRIEKILDLAITAKHRAGPNPARWAGNLERRLAKTKAKREQDHLAAMPHREIGNFMVRLAELDGLDADALQFTILTAARSGDTLKAKWKDIDLDDAIWTVPEHKAGTEPHRAPLSTATLAILRRIRPQPYDAARHGNLYVFGKLGGHALRRVLSNRLGMGNGVTIHGFRTGFAEWGHEISGAPFEVVEMALKHSVKSRVTRAYWRDDALPRRRVVMEGWAKYATTPAVDRGQVVRMVVAAQ